MTLLPGDFVSLRPDGELDKVLVEVEGQACAHIPDRLLQRSSVLQNLTITTGTASLPFPVSWLEIWSQYVDGCSTVDWLVRALKVRLLSHYYTADQTVATKNITVCYVCACIRAAYAITCGMLYLAANDRSSCTRLVSTYTSLIHVPAGVWIVHTSATYVLHL